MEGRAPVRDLNIKGEVAVVRALTAASANNSTQPNTFCGGLRDSFSFFFTRLEAEPLDYRYDEFTRGK